MRLIVKPIPKPKIETESWNEFDSKELNLKALFPKKPSLTKNAFEEDTVNVKLTVVQTHINQILYIVEVREYAKNFLPNRIDLGEYYGEWLRDIILDENKVLNQRTFDFIGYKVIEFVYQQTENDVLIHRAIVVGQNLYQQILQLEINKPDNWEQAIKKNKEKIEKFFDSFVITADAPVNRTIG